MDQGFIAVLSGSISVPAEVDLCYSNDCVALLRAETAQRTIAQRFDERGVVPGAVWGALARHELMRTVEPPLALLLLRPGGRTVEVDDRLPRLGRNHGTQIGLARCLVTAVTGLQRLAVRRGERG